MSNDNDMSNDNNGQHSLNSILSTLLKEVSDMKSNLAVNSSETNNIKNSINEIKTDVREIKNDFVNRREFSEATTVLRKEFLDANTLIKEEFLGVVKGLKKEIDLPKKIMYGIGTSVGIAIIAAILKLILK